MTSFFDKLERLSTLEPLMTLMHSQQPYRAVLLVPSLTDACTADEAFLMGPLTDLINPLVDLVRLGSMMDITPGGYKFMPVHSITEETVGTELLPENLEITETPTKTTKLVVTCRVGHHQNIRLMADQCLNAGVLFTMQGGMCVPSAEPPVLKSAPPAGHAVATLTVTTLGFLFCTVYGVGMCLSKIKSAIK